MATPIFQASNFACPVTGRPCVHNCNLGGQYGNRCAAAQNYGSPGALTCIGSRAQLQAAAQSQQAALANYYAILARQRAGVANIWQSYGPALSGTVNEPVTSTPREPLPRADPIVGELVGWRVWFVCEGYLKSFSAGYIWLPDEPMTGVPSDYGDAGVWAFKRKRAAFAKAFNRGYPTVVGSVYMWGEVIEHEDGWRAEYAAVRSLDAIFGLPGVKLRFWRTCAEERDALNDIRERYGVKS